MRIWIKTHIFLSLKGKKYCDIARSHLSKMTDITCLLHFAHAMDKCQHSSYITCHWNWMNIYWKFWIGGLSGRFSVSSFYNFWKMTLWDITAFFFFFTQTNLRWILVSVALKEVISFFWRSVYFSCDITHILQWPQPKISQMMAWFIDSKYVQTTNYLIYTYLGYFMSISYFVI